MESVAAFSGIRTRTRGGTGSLHALRIVRGTPTCTQHRIGFTHHHGQVRHIFTQTVQFGLGTSAQRKQLSPVRQQLAGPHLLPPARHWRQGGLELRQGRTASRCAGAQERGEGLGRGRTALSRQVFCGIQHVKRELERRFRRESRILWTVSSHDCTLFAVVVRSSPFLAVGAALIPWRDAFLS